MKNKQPIKDWQHYEQLAFDLFRTTGLPCEKNVSVRGARYKHQIDVLVRLNILPGNHLWVIECKNWATPVKKDTVQSFRAVLDDIGADHGYLLTENGYQRGAIAMAKSMNITLISLSELTDLLVSDQLKEEHLQSRYFRTMIREQADEGGVNAHFEITLIPRANISMAENIIEAHFFFKDLHWQMGSDDLKKCINKSNVLEIMIPWGITSLDAGKVGSKEKGYYLTGETTSGVCLSGHYLVLFRTYTGPISVNGYVPTFK